MTTLEPTYFARVDVASLEFGPVTKEHKLRVAALTPALVVQTPPVVLATAIDPDVAPFVYVKPTGKFRDFLADVEARVLAKCIDNKAEWIRDAIDDDVLRQNFKTFFKDDDFKVKVTGDAAVFDARGTLVDCNEAAEGTMVRCVLELQRICFGRQEFGAMWRLVQARVVEPVPCLIAEDAAVEPEDGPEDCPEDGPEDCPDESSAIDQQEFL